MATCIRMLFFRNVYFFECNSPLLFELFYFSGKYTEKKHMVYTECVRDKTKKQKIQKDFSDWLSASLLKQNKWKKHIASDVKSGFRNDTQTDGEIMAHFHQTAILSNSTKIIKLSIQF